MENSKLVEKMDNITAKISVLATAKTKAELLLEQAEQQYAQACDALRAEGYEPDIEQLQKTLEVKERELELELTEIQHNLADIEAKLKAVENGDGNYVS